MNKEELATKLNGREIYEELSEKEEAEIKAAGLVVAFGASDDLLELRGAINDEVGACGGTEYPITPNGLLANECSDYDCPYYKRLVAGSSDKVTAEWDVKEYSWYIGATLPFAPFDIMEDGEKYCRGIVFEMPHPAEGKE
jgi:hypothetical protein